MHPPSTCPGTSVACVRGLCSLHARVHCNLLHNYCSRFATSREKNAHRGVRGTCSRNIRNTRNAIEAKRERKNADMYIYVCVQIRYIHAQNVIAYIMWKTCVEIVKAPASFWKTASTLNTKISWHKLLGCNCALFCPTRLKMIIIIMGAVSVCHASVLAYTYVVQSMHE